MDAPEKVVPLRGDLPPQIPGRPVPQVLRMLERLLVEAQEGEITSLAVVYIGPNKTGNGWHGGSTVSELVQLLGSLSVLSHRLTQAAGETGE